MTATDKVWPWKLLLAVILIVTAAGIYGSVSRIDYEWRWYRVPQYFLYKAEEVIKTPFDGVVKNVSVSGSEAVVDLVSLDGEQQQLIVDGETVKVDAGEDLFEGDTIGFVYEWNMGPLLTGLWTTMWISAVFERLRSYHRPDCRVDENFQELHGENPGRHLCRGDQGDTAAGADLYRLFLFRNGF